MCTASRRLRPGIPSIHTRTSPPFASGPQPPARPWRPKVTGPEAQRRAAVAARAAADVATGAQAAGLASFQVPPHLARWNWKSDPWRRRSQGVCTGHRAQTAPRGRRDSRYENRPQGTDSGLLLRKRRGGLEARVCYRPEWTLSMREAASRAWRKSRVRILTAAEGGGAEVERQRLSLRNSEGRGSGNAEYRPAFPLLPGVWLSVGRGQVSVGYFP